VFREIEIFREWHSGCGAAAARICPLFTCSERFQGKRPKRIRPRPNSFILYSNTSTYGLEPRGVCGSPYRILSLVSCCRLITSTPAARQTDVLCSVVLRGYNGGVGSRRGITRAPPSTTIVVPYGGLDLHREPSTETILVLIATVKNRRQQSTRRRSVQQLSLFGRFG